MISCPTCTKNLEWYLALVLLALLRSGAAPLAPPLPSLVPSTMWQWQNYKQDKASVEISLQTLRQLAQSPHCYVRSNVIALSLGVILSLSLYRLPGSRRLELTLLYDNWQRNSKQTSKFSWVNRGRTFSYQILVQFPILLTQLFIIKNSCANSKTYLFTRKLCNSRILCKFIFFLESL